MMNEDKIFVDDEVFNIFCYNTNKIKHPPPNYTFLSDSNTWCVKINEDGIFFNHEKFPNATPESFAQAFIDILEKNFSVTFTKKMNNYDHF